MPAKTAEAPTAVLIVRDFDGIAIHTLLNIQRLFPNHYRNIVFISVGVIDTGQFKGHEEIESLRRTTEENLKSLVEFANCLGWYAEYRYDLGVDLIAELETSMLGSGKRLSAHRIFQRQVGISTGKRLYPDAAQSYARSRCNSACNSTDTT